MADQEPPKNTSGKPRRAPKDIAKKQRAAKHDGEADFLADLDTVITQPRDRPSEHD